MKLRPIYTALLAISAGLVLAGMTACSKSAETTASDTETVAETTETVEENTPERVVYTVSRSASGDIQFDGSSVTTFEQDLETAAAEMEEGTYQALDGAIKYMLMYDLEVSGDKSKLYAKLNGLTAKQIINRARR